MTIDHLRYFLAAAQYLNFSRAAESLYIHPTTMSRSITSMEEELGAPLFHRMKYSLQLTELGFAFRQEAEEIVERYDRMISHAQKAAEALAGHLSILSPELYYQMLAGAYADFYRSYPNVEFAVDVCPFSKIDTICAAVIDDTIDLGITFSMNFHDENDELDCMKIYEERQMLTVPINHPYADRESIRISDLRDTTILVADHQGKENLRQLTQNIDPSNSVQMNPASSETLLLKFTAGLGLTLMPGIVAQNSGANFHSLRIEDFNDLFDVLLIWKKTNKNPFLPVFIEQVKTHAIELKPVEC